MTEKNEEKTLQYIALTLMEQFGPVRQNLLLNICGDIDRLFTFQENELITMAEGYTKCHTDVEQIREFVRQRNNAEIRKRAEEIWKASQKKDISMITREDAAYPQRFRNLDGMPVLLYAKGDLRINNHKASTGIIGARRCSREGRDQAIEITKTAIADGKAVISGMAKGIDSYAHTAAIKENGYTIAVLGNGPDICYPNEHRALYEAIIRNGCILSEYPPGKGPRRYMFPQRNRLIAGLSDELYVINAGRHSGTESTITYCQKYGRKVALLQGQE